MMIFIPRNIWEKQLIRLGGRIFGWHKTRCYDVKVIPHVEYPAQSCWCKYQASRWILSWKKLKGICMESMECPRESLNEDAQKKNDTLCTFVVVRLKSLLTPNRLIVGMLIMYLTVMLQRPISKVGSAIRLCFNRGVY